MKVFGRKNQTITTDFPVFTTGSRENAYDYINGLKMLAKAAQERYMYKISVERVSSIFDLNDMLETNIALTDANNLLGWSFTPIKEY